jgi:ERCC4-related helicase
MIFVWAIVFLQWQESVKEIISVLSSKPALLRPCHFVGQGYRAQHTFKRKWRLSLSSSKCCPMWQSWWIIIWHPHGCKSEWWNASYLWRKGCTAWVTSNILVSPHHNFLGNGWSSIVATYVTRI